MNWLTLPLCIESLLVCVILFLFCIRPPHTLEKLTDDEVRELCEEWEPEPLINTARADHENDDIVLESAAGPYVSAKVLENGKCITKTMLNMAGFDFLGLGMREELRQAALATLDKYGCGSCGPRGFYGTIDTHVDLEAGIAEFIRSDEAIIYSDGASATSSAIPAFAKRGGKFCGCFAVQCPTICLAEGKKINEEGRESGTLTPRPTSPAPPSDLIVADVGCHDAVRTGIVLSRSFVKFFKHNDMRDLERVLQRISDADLCDGRSRGKAIQLQRRFIVVEGLYRNYGDFCPLPELVTLKEQYGFRLIMDESFSFGALGATGRGIAEYYGVDRGAVEITTASMGNALSSIGGFCAGSREVVDHQRLSGAGYCFSASAPPFLSAVATASLALVASEGTNLVRRLRSNAMLLHEEVGGIKGLRVTSAEGSPIVHCALDHDHVEHRADRMADLAVLAAIARASRAHGAIVVHSKYVAALEGSDLPCPSLRLTVSAAHTPQDVAKGAAALAIAVAEVLGELV